MARAIRPRKRSRRAAPARRARKKTLRPRAEREDKYDLYQRSVQEPPADIRFFRRIFRVEFGRRPHLLREDFCAAGFLSTTWVKSDPDNRAYGFDIDPEPLRWGLKHNASKLRPAQRKRLFLRRGNALTVRTPKVDAVAALNFSYYLFKKRDELRAYFRAAYRNLKSQGVLFVDMMGGPDAISEMRERRRIDGFTYIWDQERFDPIENRMQCYIHFRFSDGSKMRRAFRYDWRIWTLPEVRELLAEAGFERNAVYWEGVEPRTGEGNGIFTNKEHAEYCDCWIAYVVGIKDSRSRK